MNNGGETILYQDAPAKPAMLLILDGDDPPRAVLLPARAVLGRADSARAGMDTGGGASGAEVDIPLLSCAVSPRHGEIAMLESAYFYRDLDSENGTVINGRLYGKKATNGRKIKRLENGDVLQYADGETEHAAGAVIIFTTDYEDGDVWTRIHLDAGIAEINIGRMPTDASAHSGVRIDRQAVSRLHATFFRTASGRWAIKDHGSKNGVFVNNKRLEASVYLNPFDVARIVNRHFIFLADGLWYQNDAPQPLPMTPPQSQPDTSPVPSSPTPQLTPSPIPSPTPQPTPPPIPERPAVKNGIGAPLIIHITERSVWQRFKKKTLLRDISLTIHAGEMALILGGSGAGKTTFMNAVMGYEKAKGKILHGAVDIYDEYDDMKYEIAFVPQQDLLRGSDTVLDTLRNAAKMKLPADTEDDALQDRVTAVLQTLGLTRESGSLVSKLSGGQRKRLSIAVEYVADPSLFFLDEPDSGLDGVMARSLHEKLRDIADTGKIVMVITHGPDRVTDLYDKIIVLAKSEADDSGHLAFYGSVAEALVFFDVNTLEGVVRRINRTDEGGEGRADAYIEKFSRSHGDL